MISSTPLKDTTDYLKTLILWVCCTLLFFSCTEERQPCLTPKVASLNIRCVHYLSDTAKTTLDTALPRAVLGAVTGSGNRYVYYTTRSANFTLSLSPDADSCTWLFTTDSLLQPLDTLNFYYQRKLQFLSNACGYTYFYALGTVNSTRHNIDSVLITNPSVTNDVNTKQLKIFIHPN